MPPFNSWPSGTNEIHRDVNAYQMELSITLSPPKLMRLGLLAKMA